MLREGVTKFRGGDVEGLEWRETQEEPAASFSFSEVIGDAAHFEMGLKLMASYAESMRRVLHTLSSAFINVHGQLL